ncbi:MAG: flagellar biosynthesis protein FliO [Xanthobacteraceae bacterium]
MFDVFGAEMPLAVRFFLAFLIVLGLIGATAWAVRRFGGGRLSNTTRGRQPRLAVIDYASVDARRRLILIRRDNVEHLLMIGGPTDVVVEPNIVRATPAARDAPSARPPVAADNLPRVIPLPEAPSNGSWPLQPEPAAPPLPPAPPRRMPRAEPLQDEQRSFPPPPPPEMPSRPQREALAALADDLAASPVPPLLPRNRAGGPPRPPQNEPRADARPEPRMPAPSADMEAPSAVDQNLAEMAQRLEAALRKPKAVEAREAPSPIAPGVPTPPTAAPPVPPPEPRTEAEEATEPPAPPPPSSSPPPLPRMARPGETRPLRPAPKAKEGKAIYDTLEQEMASLLGRPPGKTN